MRFAAGDAIVSGIGCSGEGGGGSSMPRAADALNLSATDRCEAQNALFLANRFAGLLAYLFGLGRAQDGARA